MPQLQRKLAEGKTHKEALRCLKRRISDALYARLRADARTKSPGGQLGSHSVSRAAGLTPRTPALRASHSRAQGQPTIPGTTHAAHAAAQHQRRRPGQPLDNDESKEDSICTGMIPSMLSVGRAPSGMFCRMGHLMALQTLAQGQPAVGLPCRALGPGASGAESVWSPWPRRRWHLLRRGARRRGSRRRGLAAQRGLVRVGGRAGPAAETGHASQSEARSHRDQGQQPARAPACRPASRRESRPG
jgi:hypothetical protein